MLLSIKIKIIVLELMIFQLSVFTIILGVFLQSNSRKNLLKNDFMLSSQNIL